MYVRILFDFKTKRKNLNKNLSKVFYVKLVIIASSESLTEYKSIPKGI
jgi:hypothetical protein